MRKLAKKIGRSHSSGASVIADRSSVKRVLILRPNGRLGNLLLITPLVQEITGTFPEAKIDLFVKGGLAPILFKNYPNVDHIIRLPGKPFKELIKYMWAWISLRKYSYDVVINVIDHSSSGKLSTLFAAGKHKLFEVDQEAMREKYGHEYAHIAKFPVFNLRHFLSSSGIEESHEPVPLLDLKLSAEEIANGKKLLEEHVKNDKKTICLYTHATGSKCYSEEDWLKIYEALKLNFPDFNILEILPIENISKLSFKAPSYYSRDLLEMGGLLANAAVFVGADCGVMHLASASHVPTVGLFSLNNVEVYKPYGNNSRAIKTDGINKEAVLEALQDIFKS